MGVIRQVAKNTIAGWGAVLIRTAVAFYMVPFLLRHLGRSGYGIVGLLGVLLSLSTVVDLGLRQALGRELAEQVAKKDYHAFNDLINTGLLFCMGMGTLVATGCLVLAPSMVAFFKVPTELQRMAVNAVRIYGAGAFLLSFMSAICTAALTSTNRFDVRNNIESGSRLLTSLMLILVISQTKNRLYGWVAVMLAGQFLMVGLHTAAIRRLCPWLALGRRHVRLARARSLFGFGWKVYVLQLTHTISKHSSPLVVSRFFGPAGVALYAPGNRLSGMLRSIALTLSLQLHPVATRQHVESAGGKQKRMLIEGTRLTLLMGILFSVGLFVFAEPLCARWLGGALGGDYRIVVTIMQLFAVVDLQICTASMQWPMMLGARRLDAMMWIHGSTAILNITLSVYFAGYTALGVPGVLVGTIITGAILRPALIWYGARVFKIPLLTFLSRALLRPLFVACALLPVAYAIRAAVKPRGYPSLLACCLATGAVWLGLLMSVAFSAEERSWLSARLRSMFLRPPR